MTATLAGPPAAHGTDHGTDRSTDHGAHHGAHHGTDATAALAGLLGGMHGFLDADVLVAFEWRDDRTAVVRAAYPPLAAPVPTLTLDRARVHAAGGVLLDVEAPRRFVSSALQTALPDRPTAVWIAATPTGDSTPEDSAPPDGGVLAVWCGGRTPDPLVTQGRRFDHLRAELARTLRADGTARGAQDLALRFDAIMAAVPQAVAFVDDAAGTGLVNAAAAALLDVPAGPVAPGRLAARMAALRARATGADALEASVRALAADPAARIDGWVWQLDSGTVAARTLRVATMPVTQDGARGRLWTFDDVTREVAATRELHALFAAMRDVVLVLDGNGTCLRVVPTAPDLRRRLPAAAVGRRLHDIFPAAQADPLLATVRRAVAEGQPTELEYALDLRDGRAWFACTASPLGDGTVLWVARDVTARKHAEVALADSEARHRLLFDRNPVPVWVYDVETLAFLAVNAAAEALYGYTAAEFLDGLTVRDLHRGEPAAAFDAQRVGATVGALFGVRRRHATKNGQPLEVETSSHPITFAGRTARLVIAHNVTARVRAEAAVQASEARFRAAMAASPDACFLLETVRGADGRVEDFVFVEANAGAGSLYGLPPEDLPGHALCALFPMLRGDALLAHYAAVAETGAPYEGEYATRDPRARATWLWVQAVALRGADGAIVGIAVTARDITAHKRSEGEQRLLHEVTAALGAAPDVDGALGAALASMCTETGMAYGEAWIPADAGVTDATGALHGPGALVRGPSWHVPDDARLAAFAAAGTGHVLAPGAGLPGRAAATGRAVWEPDVSACGADHPGAALADLAGLRGGLAVPMLADGTVVAVLAFHPQHAPHARQASEAIAWQVARLAAVSAQIGNVVRRRQAEADLAREREFLTAVLENMAEGVVACDAAGRLTVFNRASREIHGLPAVGALAPEQWGAYYHLYRADGVTPLPAGEIPLVRALRGDAVRGAEMVVAAAGAPPRTLVASGQRVTSAGGKSLGAVVAMHDVTERVEAERRKSEFVSTVSHELRTPLTSIRGSLGLIDAGVAGPLPERAAPLVRIAIANVERLVRLVNDVLDLGKIEAGQLEYAMAAQDPADLVRAAVDGIAGMAATAHVEVVTQVDTRSAVLGDRDRLIQVLTNLLSNAIKFSPPHSAVVASAGPYADASGGSGVRFAVEDYGPGIPPDKIALLFQRFRQLGVTDATRRGGTGLGLAITKAIVEQHGGRVGVASEPGRRTVFWCDLPVGSVATMGSADL